MSTYPFNQPTEQRQATQYQQQQTQQSQQTATTPSVTGVQGVSPAIDVIDNDDELWVFVDLPGFRETETQVQADENTLVITGERLDELEEGRSVLVRERPTRMERTIQLPVPVDPAEAEAAFEDGVCKVVLPKAASERLREIEFS